jgi:hypothetical protein
MKLHRTNPRTIRLAIECDEGTYNRFGNYNATAEYIISIMSGVSAIFHSEIDTVLQITTLLCGPTDTYTYTTDSGMALTQFT